jgi:C-terminal processing protease CtpA/Prc
MLNFMLKILVSTVVALTCFVPASRASSDFVDDAMTFCKAISESYSGFYVKTDPSEMTSADFQQKCDGLITQERTMPSESRKIFYQRLMQLGSRLHDGHLIIRDKRQFKVWNTGLAFLLVEGHPVVTANEGGPADVELGDEIISIAGRLPLEFQAFSPLMLNRPDYANYVKIGLLGVFFSPDEPSQDTVPAVFRSVRTGQIFTTTLQFREGLPVGLPKTMTTLRADGMGRRTIVWQVNSFEKRAKSAILNDLKMIRDLQASDPDAMKRLVIDLRRNPGGTTEVGNSLLGLFVSKAAPPIDIRLRFLCSDTIRNQMSLMTILNLFTKGCPAGASGEFSALAPIDWRADHDPEFDQFNDIDFSSTKIAVLTSPFTFSTAENFSNLMKIQERATLVGEITGGGGMVPFVFKDLNASEITIGIPGLVMYYGNLGKFTAYEAQGVLPDVSCSPTSADIQLHKDRCLTQALRVLEGQFAKN